MGFVGMQPVRNLVSMTTSMNETRGASCEVLKDPTAGSLPQDMPNLRHVCFGSIKCRGYERKLHSYLGEGFAGNWGLRKCHHCEIIGISNYWDYIFNILRFLDLQESSFYDNNFPLPKIASTYNHIASVLSFSPLDPRQ